MSATYVDKIRVICSGGKADPHVVRELVLLHRRKGRPDLALMAMMAGDPERAAAYERFEPGWDAAGSYSRFEPGTGRRSHNKTEVTVVPGRRGGQVVHVPACPTCGRGKGLRLSVDRLEEAAPLWPDGIDIARLRA